MSCGFIWCDMLVSCVKRRRYLSALGSVSAFSIAGCVNPDGFRSLGDKVQADVGSFTMQNFTIQQSIAYRGSVHQRIRNERDTQYLIFGIDTVDNLEEVGEKLYDRFTLSLDGRIMEEIGRPRIATKNRSELENDMYLIYDVDRDTDIRQGILVFSDLNRDHEWSLDKLVNAENLSQYVRNPPDPTVKSFSTPNTIQMNKSQIIVDVTVSDRNDGLSMEEPLKILIGSTDTSGSTAFTATATPGETTHQFNVRVYPKVGPNKETLRVNWGQDSISKEVEIEET